MNRQWLGSQVQRASAPACKAVSWWIRELAALVPNVVTAWIGGDERQAIVRMNSDQPRPYEQLDFELTFDGESIAHLSPAIQARIKHSGCILMLPISSVLRQILELPLAASGEIVAASSFFIERITPFTLNQVQYACSVVGKDRVRQVVKVEITVVPNYMVEAWTEGLKVQGIWVSGFRVEGDRQALLLTSHAHNVSRFTRRSSWYSEPWKVLLVVGIALFACGPSLVVAQVHERARVLQASVSEAKTAGQSTINVEVQALTAEANFIPKHISAPYSLEILDELAQLLPDDTWIFSFDLTQDEIRIMGFSSAIPIVLEKLRQGQTFSTPELIGSVIHGSGRDRFDIRLHTVQGRL